MARRNGGARSVIEALIEAQSEMLEAVQELVGAQRATIEKTIKLEGAAARMGRLLGVVGDTLQNHEKRLAALEEQ